MTIHPVRSHLMASMIITALPLQGDVLPATGDPVRLPVWAALAGMGKIAARLHRSPPTVPHTIAIAPEIVATEDDGELAIVLDSPAPRLAPATSFPLTNRELDVLRLVMQGCSNRAIAEHLFISERTVGNHITHILTKLDLDCRTAAAVWGVRNGIA